MMGKLTALKVKSLKEPGRYSDGDGLLLWVKRNGGRSWVLRIQVNGRRRDFGLGAEKTTSLADARQKASEVRKLYKSGIDPVAAKTKNVGDAAQVMTFEGAARRAHLSFKDGWKNPKHQDQWINTLETYAFPHFGKLPVADVAASHIISALNEIWTIKPETGRRVKQRIGAVLDWAFSQGMRETEAPMRAIGKGLKSQNVKPGHFAALDYSDAAAFFELISKKDTVGSYALRFLLLTAARSGEVRGATWSEIDLDRAVWTVPAERMKAGREHIVPLSPAAAAILKAMSDAWGNQASAVVFPGKSGKPLSDMTLSKVLKTATSASCTVHGFRSTFRDWAAEQETTVPGAVVEAALAHSNPNKVEAAYRRTNFLEARKSLMTAWATFLES